MKKETTGLDFVVQKNARGFDALGPRGVRLGLVAALSAGLALSMSDAPSDAQQRFKEAAVNVTSVTTSGNVVSISADGSLNHAQTWQDPEGFHVVLVNGQAAPAAARGAKVRRVGNSLELVVPVRGGANVTVQPRGNRLDLVVSGGGGALSVENFPVEQQREQHPGRAARQQPAAPPVQTPAAERAQAPKPEPKRRAESAVEGAQASQQPPATAGQPQPSSQQPEQPGAPAPAGDAVALGPSQSANAPQQPAQPPAVAQPAAIQTAGPGGFDLSSLLFSLPTMLVLLFVALAGAGAVLMRRRRGAAGEAETEQQTTKAVSSEASAHEKPAQGFQPSKGDRRKADVAVPFERRTSGPGAEDEATRRAHELAAEANGNGAQHARAESKSPASASAPAVVFGSYRIDQEVAQLVSGGPHSIEVLASRAADDRRAVETSLLKALRAPEADEDGRRRARQALEDYGFVARSCAALLLGSETFERVSAARALADMRSAQALSFLTEALYDPDPLVRNECVQSLGALGLPSAIGALLDVARRHQDVPPSVLGPALTACSVESLELGWDSQGSGHAYAEAPDAEERGGRDVRMIVPAVERYEELPEFVEDETLCAALVRIESTDAESRATAAQQLAQFQVRRAVAALASVAGADAEAAVRSAAVNSLGLINHESVFAHVIVALADEAREVRAAAARALSRLSFDRADAYVRLAETADERTLRDVARACVKAGLAAQAVARLTSEDRRQAFEAFSLLSLCVSGGEAAPVVEAVQGHRDIDTRMACIQLLGESREREIREQLGRLADDRAVPERVRRSILETVERAARPAPVEVAAVFE